MNHLSIIILVLTLSSCANIAQGLIAPNMCKKCEVYLEDTEEVIETFEGCGSSNVRLEEEAKVAAYDYIKSNNDIDVAVRCETWRQEPEGETE